MDTRSKGRESEEMALKFLESKGFNLIEKNFNAKGGELDLIMQDNDFIVFVEVKSVAPESGYSIFETLTKEKKSRLKKAINLWLLKHNKLDSIWRADFLGIIVSKEPQFEHFEFIDLNK